MGSLSTYIRILASACCLLAAVPVPTAAADAVNPLAELVDAAAQRLQLADPVAAAKWQTGAAIEDPLRVHRQLDALTSATEHPDYVRRVFTDQIAATEAVEHYRFAQWTLDPALVPAGDLAAARAQIDVLNGVMLAQIEQQWAPLHAPECAADRDDALRVAGDAHGLDEFSRRALSSATQAYCE